MVCLYCGGKTKVFNSRRQRRNNQVWRRRRCLKCLAVFTTQESADLTSTLMVMQNGVYKPFLSDLLYTEILLALQDRKNCYIEAREITNTVIRHLLKLPSSPLFELSQISAAAAKVLNRFNRRSYLRYAAEHESLQAKTKFT